MNFQFQISMREHTNQLQKFSPQLLPEFNIPLLRSSERAGFSEARNSQTICSGLFEFPPVIPQNEEEAQKGKLIPQLIFLPGPKIRNNSRLVICNDTNRSWADICKLEMCRMNVTTVICV